MDVKETELEIMCDIKNVTVSLNKIDDILGLTIFPDGSHRLTGVEGTFLQLMLDFLGVNANFKYYFDSDEFQSATQIVDTGAADMAFGQLVCNYPRFMSGDLSSTYSTSYSTFVIRKSVPLSTRFAFLYPFTFDTWLYFLAVFIVLPMFGILMLEKKLSYIDMFLQMSSCVLKQVLDFPMKSMKSKIFFLFWLFFTMIISFSYSAVFFSFMVNPLKNPPVRNFEELSDATVSGKSKCYVIYSPFLISRFRHSSSKKIRDLIQKVHEDFDYFNDIQKVIDYDEVLMKGDAIVKEISSLSLRFGTNPDLYISDDKMGLAMTSVYLRKNFCLKDRMNSFISRAWNAGLYQKLFREVQMKKVIFAALKELSADNVNPLHMHDISGVLILLLAGYIISLFVLLLEIIVKKCAKK